MAMMVGSTSGDGKEQTVQVSFEKDEIPWLYACLSQTKPGVKVPETWLNLLQNALELIEQGDQEETVDLIEMENIRTLHPVMFPNILCLNCGQSFDTHENTGACAEGGGLFEPVHEDLLSRSEGTDPEEVDAVFPTAL